VSRASRPATVRFYFDADILGLAKVVTRLRSDATFPGDPGAVVHKRRRPACPIEEPATVDSEWIPEVARRGWLIVTRDNRIQEHRAEVDAVREAEARMVALASGKAIGVWQQLEILMSQWRAIERRVSEPGPFIYVATRTTFRVVALS
jgi:hypothetical protein